MYYDGDEYQSELQPAWAHYSQQAHFSFGSSQLEQAIVSSPMLVLAAASWSALYSQQAHFSFGSSQPEHAIVSSPLLVLAAASLSAL